MLRGTTPLSSAGMPGRGAVACSHRQKVGAAETMAVGTGSVGRAAVLAGFARGIV